MTRAFFRNVRGLMIDLDGVLYVGGKALPGAAEALRRIKERGIVCRFVTNTTTKSLASLHAKCAAMGLPVEREELITAAYAGVLRLRELGRPRCFFVLQPDTLTDFTAFPVDDKRPQYVVIGDYGHGWDFNLINRVFRLLMDGAELLALHKGRYFQVEDGLEIDTGAFVAALEYATGKTATAVGKPEPAFFRLALDSMGLPAEQTVMIGDDILSDVGGAQRAGLRGVLTRTGKYRPEHAARAPVTPDLIVDSIADVPALLAPRGDRRD